MNNEGNESTNTNASNSQELGQIFMREVTRYNDGFGCTRRQLVDNLLIAAEQFAAPRQNLESPSGERFSASGKSLEIEAQDGCKWCAQGDTPKLLDADGTLISITGQPGTLCHAHEEYWWPCLRYGAELHTIATAPTATVAGEKGR